MSETLTRCGVLLSASAVLLLCARTEPQESLRAWMVAGAIFGVVLLVATLVDTTMVERRRR